MSDLINLFGEAVKLKPKIDNEKRNFENRFQRWSNKQYLDGTSHYGACGYGSMCDYCNDNSYGRPCVRALNEMLRIEKISLNYNTITFEDLWDGNYKQRKEDEKNV